MPKIRIEGYDCLNKVRMTKAINQNTPLNSKESKSITDELMSQGFVEIDIETSFNVVGLLKGLKEANANVKFTE